MSSSTCRRRPACATSAAPSLIQRDDDKEETVRKRLKVYQEQTAPLIEHFKKKGNLVDIDGSAGIDGVFDQMVKAIDRLKK